MINENTEVCQGSGNIYADLGLSDADNRYARAKLGFHIFTILEEKKLKQREIATVLGIKQPDVSHLLNGRFNRFSTDKLLSFLSKLNQQVTIHIAPRHGTETAHEISFPL